MPPAVTALRPTPTCTATCDIIHHLIEARRNWAYEQEKQSKNRTNVWAIAMLRSDFSGETLRAMLASRENWSRLAPEERALLEERFELLDALLDSLHDMECREARPELLIACEAIKGTKLAQELVELFDFGLVGSALRRIENDRPQP